MAYLDGTAESIRQRINFDAFKLDTETLSIYEIDLLLSIPEVDTGCRIKKVNNKSGSAFSQMSELGIVAGFMRSSDESIKVLVVYTERPNDDGSYDFGFVGLGQVKHLSKKPVKEY
jgi:hypothetical protein